MKKLIFLVIAVMMLSMTGCGKDTEECSTCTEMMTEVYAIPNCTWYFLDTSPPTEISLADAIILCRQISILVYTDYPQCEHLLNDWLNCRPIACIWNDDLQMFLADDCNDEFERLLYCD